MPTDLMTAACHDGQSGSDTAEHRYILSSDLWMAYRAGRQMKGMSAVRRCHKSRGHSVKAHTIGGNTVTVKFSGEDLSTLTVDRV